MTFNKSLFSIVILVILLILLWPYVNHEIFDANSFSIQKSYISFFLLNSSSWKRQICVALKFILSVSILNFFRSNIILIMETYWSSIAQGTGYLATYSFLNLRIFEWFDMQMKGISPYAELKPIHPSGGTGKQLEVALTEIKIDPYPSPSPSTSPIHTEGSGSGIETSKSFLILFIISLPGYLKKSIHKFYNDIKTKISNLIIKLNKLNKLNKRRIVDKIKVISILRDNCVVFIVRVLGWLRGWLTPPVPVGRTGGDLFKLQLFIFSLSFVHRLLTFWFPLASTGYNYLTGEDPNSALDDDTTLVPSDSDSESDYESETEDYGVMITRELIDTQGWSLESEPAPTTIPNRDPVALNVNKDLPPLPDDSRNTKSLPYPTNPERLKTVESSDVEYQRWLETLDPGFRGGLEASSSLPVGDGVRDSISTNSYSHWGTSLNWASLIINLFFIMRIKNSFKIKILFFTGGIIASILTSVLPPFNYFDSPSLIWNIPVEVFNQWLDRFKDLPPTPDKELSIFMTGSSLSAYKVTENIKKKLEKSYTFWIILFLILLLPPLCLILSLTKYSNTPFLIIFGDWASYLFTFFDFHFNYYIGNTLLNLICDILGYKEIIWIDLAHPGWEVNDVLNSLTNFSSFTITSPYPNGGTAWNNHSKFLWFASGLIVASFILIPLLLPYLQGEILHTNNELLLTTADLNFRIMQLEHQCSIYSEKLSILSHKIAKIETKSILAMEKIDAIETSSLLSMEKIQLLEAKIAALTNIKTEMLNLAFYCSQLNF